ncbi:MAG: hypothetical protein EOO99_08875 [Pedobacter sp.]|nr:MAG: hypothetical protein EOO99_08875 [Pedobacter sp.]
MKKLLKLLFILTLIYPLGVNGQLPVNDNLKIQNNNSVHEEVNRILRNNMKTSIFKDSVAYYPYLIKLSLIREKNQNVKVEDIIVSDSMVYEIFPEYEKLKDVNFDNILLNEGKLEYRIPVLIVCEKASKNQAIIENGIFPIIDMHSASSAIAKIFNLFYTGNPNNSKVIFQQPLFSTTLYRIP